MVDSNCENSKVITAHFSKIHENWTDRLILGVTVGEFELLEIHHFKSKLLRKAFSHPPVRSVGIILVFEAPVTWFGARGLQIKVK